jgi:rod shape-determining protein MreC
VFQFFYKISQIFTLGRGSVSFALALFFSILMMNAPESKFSHSMKLGLSHFFFPLQVSLDWFSKWRSLGAENEILKAKIGLIEVENHSLRLELQKISLKTKKIGQNLVVELAADSLKVNLAAVIGRGGNRFNSTLIINRGRYDSLSKWMPVFTEKGVVGVVDEVYGNYSFIKVLSAKNSRVGVTHKKSNSHGILESVDGFKVSASYPSYLNLRRGDSLVTSGLGGIFPSAIPVGIISKLVRHPNDVLVKVEVELFQKVYQLNEVLVIEKEPNHIVLEK